MLFCCSDYKKSTKQALYFSRVDISNLAEVLLVRNMQYKKKTNIEKRFVPKEHFGIAVLTVISGFDTDGDNTPNA